MEVSLLSASPRFAGQDPWPGWLGCGGTVLRSDEEANQMWWTGKWTMAIKTQLTELQFVFAWVCC